MSFCYHGIVKTALIVSASLGMHLQAFSADWKPEANVEIVIPSGPGSGLDKTGRTVQRLIQTNKLLPVTTTAVNKPGGGGTLAYLYINQQQGNGHFLSITSPGVVTNKLVGASKVDFRDLTPIAQLFEENIAFMVLPDSKIKDGKTLISMLKKDPTSISFGIATALGGANHIAAASALKKAGVDVRRLRNAVFKSGGEVTVALLGGHVDVVPISAPVAVPHVEGGKVRVIAVSSASRLGGALANAPTWEEQGIDSTYSTWRGVVAPTGVSQAQIAYWDGIFEKLTATDEWKKEMKVNLWVANYLNSGDSKNFLEQQRKEHYEILNDLGMVK
jgi:putative tricarboxylic transport membrane protein